MASVQSVSASDAPTAAEGEERRVAAETAGPRAVLADTAITELPYIRGELLTPTGAEEEGGCVGAFGVESGAGHGEETKEECGDGGGEHTKKDVGGAAASLAPALEVEGEDDQEESAERIDAEMKRYLQEKQLRSRFQKEAERTLPSQLRRQDLILRRQQALSLDKARADAIERRQTRHQGMYTQVLVVIAIAISQFLFIYDQVQLTLKDRFWLRIINVLWVPVFVFFMLFTVQYAVNQVVCILGPVAHMQSNSQFFSAIAPPRPLHYPKMTIQMPVYKEGLHSTILPTILSLEVAIRHYRKAGGQASIFINDDGLQVISEEDRRARITAYHQHEVGYVARPDPSVRPRVGLFKKASNMNYALNISLEVQGLRDNGATLSEATDKVRKAWNDEALIGGDVSIGDIILLVDSDTRVPPDCLTNVLGEFVLTPSLGFLQCRTTPLRANANYWEDMIGHFTESIYDVGIALAVSAGDPAPLVGHNAFLRWDAVKQASWVDKKDGERKFWSEAHVSEDFDLSLRLQTLGYIGRYCTYTGPGFQEGVSLTAADEVIRLRKYAFGACEMLLNRFMDWPTHGPITPLYRRYLSCPGVPWSSKLAMSGYLGTYLAMAYTIVGVSTYVAMRMLAPALQEQMTNTFDIYMTTLLLFGGIGCLGSGTIRYRMGYARHCKSIFGAVCSEIQLLPVVTIFFGSMLWHLTTACWNYFWDIPMVWGATAKETEKGSSFGVELRATFERYKSMFVFMSGYTIVFCLTMWLTDMPWGDVRLTFPVFNYILLHVCGPFLLNPILLRGHY